MLLLGMDKLIENVKASHLAIIDQIDQIHQGIRHYLGIKPKLRALQSILLNHFNLQKQQIYKQLETFYSSDREKSKLIEFLVTDLRDLKIKTLVFFDEHPADMGDQKPKGVIQDFENLSHDILGRIHHEKKYFIPMLQECV